MLPKHLNKSVIVFDLDETLGYFSEFSIVWKLIEIMFPAHITTDNSLFFTVLDLYPELLRPKIIKIFKMIVKHQRSNIDTNPFQLMIFTNNQGGKHWVNLISKYFEYKVDGLHFEHIINAFMIDKEVIEPSRTSHHKKYSDFLDATRLPKQTKMCFIDDVHFQHMVNDNVFYIHIKPYKHALKYTTFIEKLLTHPILGHQLSNKYTHTRLFESLAVNMSPLKEFVDKTTDEHNIDIIVSKRIYGYLEEFIFEFRHI